MSPKKQPWFRWYQTLNEGRREFTIGRVWGRLELHFGQRAGEAFALGAGIGRDDGIHMWVTASLWRICSFELSARRRTETDDADPIPYP